MEQTESTQPTNSTPSLFSPKNLIPLSIFAAVLVVLTSVGTYMVLKSKTQKAPIPQTLSISPTIATDDMKNWKTYTNSKFGYSFQYPPTLSVSNCPSYDCGEIIYYPLAPGKVEINENNRLGDIALVGGHCQYENQFKD